MNRTQPTIPTGVVQSATFMWLSMAALWFPLMSSLSLLELIAEIPGLANLTDMVARHSGVSCCLFVGTVKHKHNLASSLVSKVRCKGDFERG